MKMTDILLNRRTIRKYSARVPDDQLINGIINAGCRTSTTGNMQVYSIIITRDAEKKKESALISGKGYTRQPIRYSEVMTAVEAGR